MRTIYPEVPPKVEYSLSELGKSMEPIIRMLQKWGLEYMGRTRTQDTGRHSQKAEAAVSAELSKARG